MRQVHDVFSCLCMLCCIEFNVLFLAVFFFVFFFVLTFSYYFPHSHSVIFLTLSPVIVFVTELRFLKA